MIPLKDYNPTRRVAYVTFLLIAANVLVYFLVQIGFYGVNIWLPKVVGTITGGVPFVVGWVTAIPYVLAIVALWFNAKAAVRSGRYSTHVRAHANVQDPAPIPGTSGPRHPVTLSPCHPVTPSAPPPRPGRSAP